MPIGHLWWIKRAGEAKGPFPAAVIEKNIASGRIVATDQISSDGERWLLARSYPDFEVLAASGKLKTTRAAKDDRLAERRRPTREGPSPAERRETEDRRDEEDPQLIARRERSNRVWQSLRPSSSAARLLPFLILALLGIGVFLLSLKGTSMAPLDERCAEPPQPTVNWEFCNRAGQDLHAAKLHGAVLRNMQLAGADLTGADLSGADLAYADLSGALLREARLDGARLVGANLKGAVLEGANLTQTNLSFADFTGAILKRVVLKEVTFERTLLPSGSACSSSDNQNCPRLAISR